MDAPSKPTVLVLDDEKNIRRSIQIALEPEGFEVIEASDPTAALRMLRARVVDLLLLDIRLGEIDGLTFYRRLQADGMNVPTIFISGHATLTEAAQAVKLGGFDFLEKPFSSDKLAICAKRCIEYAALEQRLRLTQDAAAGRKIVGESATIRKVIAEALKVAPTSASALITGESGTGKELIANAIHAHSERSAAAFVKVNCSAIPESLVESELFGHERGAFTGALAQKKGLFEIAHRGTIFLDEVADLSLAAQAKILRVLQSGEIRRVGAEQVMKVDVRVLSGTHKDLRRAVEAGTFREDLFYRLNVVPIRVPSLRERAEDIPLLARALLKRLCESGNVKEKPIDEDVLAELRRYHWPGNVRELENVLQRMLILSGERISAMNLPEEIVAHGDESQQPRSGPALREFRDAAERDFIVSTLRRTDGNISRAAIELGVSRTYLHRRLGVLRIGRKDYF